MLPHKRNFVKERKDEKYVETLGKVTNVAHEVKGIPNGIFWETRQTNGAERIARFCRPGYPDGMPQESCTENLKNFWYYQTKQGAKEHGEAEASPCGLQVMDQSTTRPYFSVMRARKSGSRSPVPS